MAQERDETTPEAGNGLAATNGSKNPFDKRLDSESEEYGLDGDFYEEPDRDTDGSASFYDHSIEDEETFDEPPTGDPARTAQEPQNLTSSEVDEGLDELDDELDNLTDDWDEQDMTPEQEAEAWLDDRGYPAEEAEGGQAWPLGLIAVALIALVLLIAGGYGVMQQRAATQEEIRELRAALATAASPEEVAESRTAAAEAEQRNIQLKEQLYTLSAENRRLSDTVAGLETQMAVQQRAISTAMEKARTQQNSPAAIAARTKPAPKPVPRPAAKPKPKPAPVQVAAKPKPAPVTAAKPAPAATPAAAGGWFVNFGSYGSESAAQNWVNKLKPAAGRVITAPGEKNGRTFYRVRVVDLPSKLAAQNVARLLEQEYKLSKLWIGKQS